MDGHAFFGFEPTDSAAQRPDATPRLVEAARSRAPTAPLYEAALAFFSRDARWRRALAAQIAPASGDMIVEIGCGSGSLALLLAQTAPGVRVLALDPNPAALARAQARFAAAGIEARTLQADWAEAGRLAQRLGPNKVALGPAAPGMSLSQRRAQIVAAREALAAGGAIHAAEMTRSPAVRPLPEALAQPPAPGLDLHAHLRAAGFVAVERTQTLALGAETATLHRGRA